MKRLIASTLSAAVFMAAVTPAAAQAYRYSEAFAPQQNEVTATVNYRIPLGVTSERATVGLTLSGTRADQAVETADGNTFNSDVRIADLRFDGRGVERALVGGYDFAPRGDAYGYDDSKDPKDPKDGKEGKDPKFSDPVFIVGTIVVIGLVAWAIAENNDSSNHHSSPST